MAKWLKRAILLGAGVLQLPLKVREFNMKMMIAILVIAACLMGCTHGMDDNLSSVPVTNNPNIFPMSSQTAQNPGFGN